MKTFIMMCLFSVSSVWAQGVFNTDNYNNDGELTAQEEHEAGNYIHQGVAQQNYQDICSGNHDLTKDLKDDQGNMTDICTNGENAFDGNMRILESMMPMVNKAYSMLGVAGMMGGGGPQILGLSKPVQENGGRVFTDNSGNEIKANPGNEENPTYTVTDDQGNESSLTEDQMKKNDDYDTKEESQKDMCAMIPGVTDLAAQTAQGMENQQIQEGYQNMEPRSQQSEAFRALARSQRSREKTSKWQAVGWGATAGCYVAYAATGTQTDLNWWVKFGLSGAATYFYYEKMKHHKMKAELLDKLADSFPKAGDCNPHTETQCFCSEESSVVTDLTNYQKYCVPELYAKDDTPLENKTTCIDAQGKPDPSCKCKKRRACFDGTVTKEAIRVGLNPTAMQNATGGLSNLSNGFDSSTLGPGIEQTLAMAKKQMQKFKPKKIPNLRGNKKAQKLAKSLQAAGVPRGLAATIAATRIPSSNSSGLPAFAASNLAEEFGNKTAAFSTGVPNSDPKFKFGGTVSGGKSGSSKNPFAFGKSGSKRGKGGVQVDLSGLAQKATIEADITKDSSKGIFDILSHRYKMRAWKEFEDSMTKEIE
jgi:hypothetical protein